MYMGVVMREGDCREGVVQTVNGLVRHAYATADVQAHGETSASHREDSPLG